MASDNPLPPVEIRAPRLRKRPRGLLLDVTEPIGESNVRPTDQGSVGFTLSDKLIGGVTFCGQGCPVLDTFENQWCEEVTLPADASAVDAHEFSSFAIVDRESYPAYFDPTWPEDRIRQRFDAMTSAQVARELQTGALTGGPSLVDSVTDFTGDSTPVPIDEALYVLNEMVAPLDGLEVTIHSSPGVFELLVANYSIAQDDEDVPGDPNARPFRTATGHVLVGDAGHDGSIAPDGLSTASDGSWIYATLAVASYLSEVRPVGQFNARFDHTRDTLDSIFVRDAIVAFDPCSVVAIQVEVPEYVLGS